LDSIWGGVNDWLAQGVLGGHQTSHEGQIHVLTETAPGPNGQTEGEGRLVTLKEPIDMKELEKRVSNHLRIPQSQSSSWLDWHLSHLLVGGNIVR
jgi:putative NIF3 family GTP cyclohydrolase 1 type 2